MVLNGKCGLRLNTRKRFFIGRVLRHWNRLPCGAVDAVYLKVFKRPGWIGL